MHIEHRIRTTASPEVVFGIYQDVRNWHVWDPDTKSASLDGPFQVGTRGRLTPTKGNTVPMVLTAVEAARRFTVESRIPLFRMVFEHELVRHADETEVIHSVRFSGPLRFLIGRMLVKQLNAGLPITLAKLKALAERKTRPGHE